MRRTKYSQALSFLFVLSLISVFANINESVVDINRISVLPGELSTKIILEASSPLLIPYSQYSKELPFTIVIDLDRVKNIVEPQLELEKTPLIKEIKIEKSEDDRSRLLISLQEKVPYRIFSDQQKTVIELNKIQKTHEEIILSSSIKERLDAGERKPIFLDEISVIEKEEGIDIRAKLSGEAISQIFALANPLRLVVDLYDTLYSRLSSVVPINKLGIIKVRAGQFQASSPYTITRIVFDLQESRFYTFHAENGELVISFFKDVISKPLPGVPAPSPTVSKPALPEQPVKMEDQFTPKTLAETEEKYSGELISLKLKDADLRDVVLYLGELSELNVVFDPDVKGIVTCNLVDIPWDQALDILLKNNKMGKTIEGNVLRIAPIGVLTREEEEQRRLRESKELSSPIQVKTFTLSYSKAKDIKELLLTQISERGEIIVDERTNTMVVSEVKDRIDLIEKLISVFDTATPQVSIEARIVEASSTFVRNLGIQWGWRGIADPFYGNQTSLQFPNKILVDGAMIPQGMVTKGLGGPLGGYAINLPAPAFSTAIGLSLSNAMDTLTLDMALSALETSGDGRIISRPTVTTQNNKEAEIIQGRQIPVQTMANFSVTTRYVNAALELRATPQITAEGTIIMLIELQNNAADFSNLVNGIPPITTQSARTVVMIPDGGTTVIGGIYRTEDSITRERVPFLHKIPILGSLFRSSAQTKQSRELLIFITPRIIK